MKRILAAGSIVALAMVGIAGTGTAHAAPAEAACFGQIHKTGQQRWPRRDLQRR